VLVGNKIDLAQTKKGGPNPVTKVEALSLARQYGMEYFETSSLGEESIVNVFDHLFIQLTSLIGRTPEPQQLMGKNVVLGKKILNDVKYKLALADMLPNYD